MAFKKPTRVAAAGSSKGFAPTVEQVANADLVAQGKDVKIVAGAGTGKSSSLRYIATRVPEKNILVLCFNKANADESNCHAERPENIYYATINSIAYAKIVNADYRKRLSFLSYKNLEQYDIGEYCGLPYEKAIAATKAVINGITAYCRSDKEDVYDTVYDYLWYNHSFDSTKEDVEVNFQDSTIRELATIASRYWKELVHGKASISHDVYLKLYQLAGYKIEEFYDKGAKRYIKVDILGLDECLTGKHTVKTDKGLYRIKRLHEMKVKGEELPQALSYNIEREIYEYKPILSTLVSYDRETLLIKTEGLNKLECTPNHRVLTQRGYIPAGELIIGKDYLLLDNPDNQKAKLILNKDQYQIVLGSYLGDGSLDKRSEFNTYRLRLTHGISQLDYLTDKAAHLNIENIGNIKSGYTGLRDVYTAQSKTFILDNSIWECLHDLDALGLAIWYMDDGSISKDRRVILHTNAFNHAECTMLADILYSNFGLYCSIGKTREYLQLSFDVENSKKLLTLIAAYMHEDLAYKNPYTTSTKFDFDDKFKPYAGNYVCSIEHIGKRAVYDIEVADNHNFITTRSIDNYSLSSGIIVHNCQDTNPVSEAIFRNQDHLQRVIVGDPMQQLYAWRGAKDIMSLPYYDSFAVGYLSESFRFNQGIADIANFVLGKADSKLRLIGSGKKSTIDSKAVLCRTNAKVVEYLLHLMGSTEYKLYTSIDLKDVFSKLYHMEAAWFDSVPKYPCKELAHIVDRASLLKAIEMSDEIARLHKLRGNLVGAGQTITTVKKALEERLVAEPTEADVIVSTIHKSKGLQYSHVRIADDFISTEEDAMIEAIREKLWDSFTLKCMLYVAVTRAEVEIVLPWYLQGMCDESVIEDEYFRRNVSKHVDNTDWTNETLNG
jgi:hypothetical protein